MGGPLDHRTDNLLNAVHNIGGSASPASRIEVHDANSQTLSAAQVPALQPPHDLQPKTAQLLIPLTTNAKPATIILDPDNTIPEVTEANNRITWPGSNW